MTVQKDVTKNIYVGNGSTRTFPFTFECPAEHPEYIKVYLMQDDGTALATSDYQLDMDARQITYPSSGAALPEGKKLVIMRELPLQQMMNLVNNGPYFAEDVELAFDENVMAMQQIAEKLNRSIIMSVDIDGDAFVNEVPFEAGKSFRIADDGKSIVLTEDPARVREIVLEASDTAQAQAQSAYSSAVAAAQSEDSAATSATNAKTSENNAEASKEAAQSAASNANNFATSASNSASEAKSYRDAANNYAANAKNYSENVNVFLPSVSSAGVLSWTNKAGLANPASVNIKGDKGDTGAQGLKGDKGDKGDTGAQGLQGIAGTAATITIGSVTTGEPGTNASVTNSGTSTNAILNFTIPRGNPGADGGVTVDAELSDTSMNPVQNKVVKTNMDSLYNNLMTKLNVYRSELPTKVSDLENDAGYLTQHQSLDGYAKTSVANTWTAQQNFHVLMLNREKYTTYVVNGTSDTPTTSTMLYTAVGAFTLNLATLTEALSASQSSVFTAYFAANADYSLTITNAGTLKYVGSASDIAITSAGLLLNIWMSKDDGGTLTSIVQATKLGDGA